LFDDIEAVFKYLSARYGKTMAGYVNEGMVQQEYADYLRNELACRAPNGG
jgi:hypothetical protein